MEILLMQFFSAFDYYLPLYIQTSSSAPFPNNLSICHFLLTNNPQVTSMCYKEVKNSPKMAQSKTENHSVKKVISLLKSKIVGK
jgi:hypothetical protein